MDASWIARVAASAAIRKIVGLAIGALVLVAGALISGKANAGAHSDQGTAYSTCLAVAKATTAYAQMAGSGACTGPTVRLANQEMQYTCRAGSATGSTCGSIHAQFDTNFWYPIGMTCAARPNAYGGWQTQGSTACNQGCSMTSGTNPFETVSIDRAPMTTAIVARAFYAPNGQTCGGELPAIGPPKQDYCQDLPMGHKVCRDSRGRNCVVSGSTGRKYCPESGNPSVNPERTEGATDGPGTEPAPLPTPRPGEEFTNGPKATTTHTQNSGCTSNCSTTNTSTVINNTGAPNPGGNPVGGDGSGNPGTGGDGEGEGDGDGDGDEGSVTGGGECSIPPVCTGDPLLCAQISQSYMARCADEGRAQGTAESIEGLDADDGTDGFDIEDLWTTEDEQDPGDEDLDTSGFGFGTTCPEPPEFFGELIDLSEFCTLLTAFGLLVVALGAYHSFEVLAE